MKHLVFLFSIFVSSCSFTNRQSQKIQCEIEPQKVRCETLCVNDSSLQKIIALNPKWFDSWQWEKDTLKAGDFQLTVSDSIDIKWENICDSEYYAYLTETFDTLLIALNNQFYIDLYSYNTFIEKDGNDIFVGFDVDTKVSVLDKLNKKMCEIASVGPSVETIEDAVWFGNNTIILFGSDREDQNGNAPFLWVINIQSQNECFYKYIYSFSDIRNRYIFTKFPNFKMKE